jgi:hypothetical protein
MKKERLEGFLLKLSIGLCMTSFVFVLLVTYSYWKEKQTKLEAAKTQAQQEAVRAAQKVDAQLRQMMNTAKELSHNFSQEKLDKQKLLSKLRTALEKNPQFYGVGATFVPYAFDAKRRLYSPYYFRRNGEILFEQSENLYDYTLPKYERYHLPLKQGATWLEPYFGITSNALITVFGTPFYQPQSNNQPQKPAGVVTVTFSLDQLKGLLNSLNLGRTGYSFLISKQGTYIYHPITSLVVEKKKIFDQTFKTQTQERRILAQQALQGKRGMIEDINPQTQQKVWNFYEPIPSTGWSLVVVAIQDEALGNTQNLERKLLLISLGTTAFLLCLFVLIFKAYKPSQKSLYRIASLASMLLTLELSYLWGVALHQSPLKQGKNMMIVDEAGIKKFLSELLSKHPSYIQTFTIPTGVFVQSLEFSTANNVLMTGYIWQKYNLKAHKSLNRGVVLPEGFSVKISQAYRQIDGETETIGWYFEGNLRQNFDYTKYPFDYKDIWIRMWHPDFNKNVILVPDFTSYNVMIPQSKPGIEGDFVLPGMTLEASFFEYKQKPQNTNFGLNNTLPKGGLPDLYFTILVKRDFTTTFVTNIMRVIVVACLLFAIQTLIMKKAEEIKSVGFSASGVVSACGAFIFILILDQISLRGRIAVAGILYLEYLYFVLYLMILLVALNALLLAIRPNLPILKYQDNLIPKLGYWPTLLSLVLIVTIFVFY